MAFLTSALRFIVGFFSYLIILVAVAFGIFSVFTGELLLGIIFILGGIFLSAIIFGVIALLFQINDHLAVIRKHVDESGIDVLHSKDGERIEPSLS